MEFKQIFSSIVDKIDKSPEEMGRKDRLEMVINPFLKALGLSPLLQGGVGRCTEGEFELIKPIGFNWGFGEKFVDVIWSVWEPIKRDDSGTKIPRKVGKYFVRYYVGIGELCIIIINGKYVVTGYQHRLPVGGWRNEFFRCFNTEGKEIPVGMLLGKDAPIVCEEARTLLSLFEGRGCKLKVKCQRRLDEDTGTRSSKVNLFVIDLLIPGFDDGDMALIKESTKKNYIKLSVKPLAKVFQMYMFPNPKKKGLGEGTIRGLFDSAALLEVLLEKLRELKDSKDELQKFAQEIFEVQEIPDK